MLSDADLDRFLAEDVPYGDLTTRSLGLDFQPAHMEFRAGAGMVACCAEEAGRLLTRLGCTVSTMVSSGTPCESGRLLLEASGPASAILAGWKVSQTLMEYASGIASAARAVVAAAQAVNPAVVVACTRKTFPGTRAVAVKAIVAGGATPHRLGLSDTVLLFPEHCALLGPGSMKEAIARLKAACPEKRVVVEVVSADQALAAMEAGADVVQLEKFSPVQVEGLAGRLGDGGVRIAVAGGVNAGNAADYARAGASILVTSSPYWASPLDVKVAIRHASGP